nr:ATP-binding protein [Staphylococcus aureus]
MKSTIITTNITFSSWGESFSNKIVSAAIIDRLVHHSKVFKIIGESYHKNEIKFITQRRKILSFDDEIDNLELINMFLDGLKCEFEQTNQSLKSYNNLMEIPPSK